MGLREIKFKNSYDSDSEDVLFDFYIPGLAKAIEYRRLAGFFSSSVLAAAAKGIAGLVRNNGKMKLVVGACLQKLDVEAIEKATENRETIIAENMIKALNQIESEFVKDHVKALAWMIAHDRLEIKVAIPLNTKKDSNFAGIYHPKVGILLDNEQPQNIISFSGSINESARGWSHNLEEFKVFRSWINEQRTYLQADLATFDKYWNGTAKRTLVMDVPTAVKNKLIEFAPKTFEEILINRHYCTNNRILWKHQSDAVKSWVLNNYKGIFAMATGTGKTLTALCATGLSGKNYITLILVPTLPLLEQWGTKEIPEYDKNADIIMCGGRHNWKEILPLKLAMVRKQKDQYSPSRRLYIVSTMRTSSSKGFLLAWKGIQPDNVQLICDEVHHLGAPEFQKCLMIPCSRRIGLSATPNRHWDKEGTQKIIDFFGETISTYRIEDAIRDGHLSPFRYFPHFSYLTLDEWEEYEEKTYEIGKESAIINENKDKKSNQLYLYKTKKLEKLLRERAIIKKKAIDKIRTFREILPSINEFPIIIFCEDHEQLDDIKNILKNNGKSFLVYYSSTSGKKMNLIQRAKSLDLFRKGDSDFLLAMKCLDEGLDVPGCKGCIIVASANTTRQFIQRRGRILRGLTGKTAILHDIMVFPPKEKKGQGSATETLIKQECARLGNLVKAAENEWSIREKIRQELKPFGMGYMADY